jgi:CRISPR-associated protein Cmr4
MNELLLYKCETPLHMGSGTEMGLVDMPVQREKHTGFPKMESSGIKGIFRCDFGNKTENREYTNIFFGPDKDNNDAYTGSLKFTDAKILFFPVKSAKGIFGWITCPFVIDRFNRDLEIMNIDSKNKFTKIELKDVMPSGNTAYIISNDSNLIISRNSERYIWLEEFGYKVTELPENSKQPIFKLLKYIKDNYIFDKLKKDIVVVSNEVFDYFVNMSTEVNTRIRIGSDGVVDSEDGALFTEEYIPVGSIMYGFLDTQIRISEEKVKDIVGKNYSGKIDKISEVFEEYLKNVKILHFGGNEALGKGIVSLYKLGCEE